MGRAGRACHCRSGLALPRGQNGLAEALARLTGWEILIDPGAEVGRAELEGQFSKLWWKLRYQFRPNSLHHCPYFVRDGFEDRRFNQVAMDQLQFGRHDQLAADNAGFIGEALTISSLGAGLLSMLVHTALTASLFLVFRRTYKLSVDAATVGMICAGRATDECSASSLGGSPTRFPMYLPRGIISVAAFCRPTLAMRPQ